LVYQKKHVQTKPTPFLKKHYRTKENIIIKWLTNKNVVDQVRRNNYKICESDTKCQPNQICTGILKDDVNINSIKPYSTETAWNLAIKMLKLKKKINWIRTMCELRHKKQKSILCDSCLEWYDLKCAGLKNNRVGKYWFCQNCKNEFEWPSNVMNYYCTFFF